jgi:hypothetical protein
VIEAGNERPALLRFLSPPGHGDQGDFLTPGLMTNALRELIAAQARQADIKYSDVGPHPSGEVQGLGAAVGDMHGHGTIIIVISDQNPTRLTSDLLSLGVTCGDSTISERGRQIENSLPLPGPSL